MFYVCSFSLCDFNRSRIAFMRSLSLYTSSYATIHIPSSIHTAVQTRSIQHLHSAIYRPSRTKYHRANIVNLLLGLRHLRLAIHAYVLQYLHQISHRCQSMYYTTYSNGNKCLVYADLEQSAKKLHITNGKQAERFHRSRIIDVNKIRSN